MTGRNATRRTTGITALVGALLLVLQVLLVPGTAGAAPGDTCKDLDGFDENHDEEGVDRDWGSIEFTPEDGPLVLDVEVGYTIELCVKKGNEASGQGPELLGPFTGPIEGQEVSYPGSPGEGISHYSFRLVPTPPPDTDTEATAVEPTWVEPSCAEPDGADVVFDTTEGVTYAITTGTVGAGNSIVVTATAEPGYTLTGPTTFDHTFADAPTNCGSGPGQVGPEAEQEPAPEPEPEPEPGPEDEVEDEDEVAVEADQVVRPAVSFRDPTCEAPEQAAVELTHVDGIEYTVRGDEAPGGTVTVAAHAVEGHTIPDGVRTGWTHEFTEPDDCVEVLPLVVERPPQAPAAEPAPEVQVQQQELAATGLDSPELLLLALLLFSLGATVLLGTPQPRRDG